jgi:hypothetical protein
MAHAKATAANHTGKARHPRGNGLVLYILGSWVWSSSDVKNKHACRFLFSPFFLVRTSLRRVPEEREYQQCQ